MIASAANQFQSLSIKDCSGTNFSFNPEFSTDKFGNFVTWAELQTNIGFHSEIDSYDHGQHEGHHQPNFDTRWLYWG